MYRSFTSLEDFEKAIGELRARHVVAGTPTLPGMSPPAPRRRGGGRASAAADVTSGT